MRPHHKKCIALLLCAVLILPLCACRQDRTAAQESSQSTTMYTDPTGITQDTVPTSQPEPSSATLPLPEYPLDPNTDGFAMDATLAQAIRISQGLPPEALLTRELLSSIQELFVWDVKLVSLTGLEYLTGLERFAANDTCVQDIEIITQLPNLRQFSIFSGYIRRIPDLSALPNLEELALTNQMIRDLSPLTTGQRLRWVNLSDNFIVSISPIRWLQNLSMLNLHNNCILDYASISDNAALCDALKSAGDDPALCLAAENRAKAIVSRIITPEMDDLEKEYRLYRYVIEHMEYQIVGGLPMPFGYTGLMVGKGVCADYAQAFALLAGHAGLEVFCVSSSTHMWNMVRLEDQFYHVDTLWDEGNDNFPTFFNRGDAAILETPDHDFDPSRYPAAHEMDVQAYSHLLPKA